MEAYSKVARFCGYTPDPIIESDEGLAASETFRLISKLPDGSKQLLFNTYDNLEAWYVSYKEK